MVQVKHKINVLGVNYHHSYAIAISMILIVMDPVRRTKFGRLQTKCMMHKLNESPKHSESVCESRTTLMNHKSIR